ncbi:hypothetical protein D910_02918 [Dendroctonus ponderosae]|uniref:Tyrosine-protein phosphatase domain-containing protein n=1 Tax=Dendroctonus ponderosae TaxID=77166 RepID=U4TVA1_DENPD|nr:hypothetical protein D910_02918 [Dendroctonus ponderosae]
MGVPLQLMIDFPLIKLGSSNEDNYETTNVNEREKDESIAPFKLAGDKPREDNSRAIEFNSSQLWASDFHDKIDVLAPKLPARDNSFEVSDLPENVEKTPETTPSIAKVSEPTFKETIDSVDQELDNFEKDEDDDDDTEAVDVNLSVEHLQKHPSEPSTVEYENDKGIVNNETVDTNIVHKNISIEHTRTLQVDLESSFTDTKGEGNGDTINATTVLPLPTTRKSFHLKDVVIEKSNTPVLNNNIETEIGDSVKDTSTTTPSNTILKFKGEANERKVRKVAAYTTLSDANGEPVTVDSTTEDSAGIVPTDSGYIKEDEDGNYKGKVAAIALSCVGAVCLIVLAGLLYVMKKRQKRLNYGPRCRPVSLDDYSIDNLSVYSSVRRKGGARQSKRSFGNPAFEDPVAPTHPLNFTALAKFSANLEDIRAEYEDIPQITARNSELPDGCDTKNRYSNVIPLPETRVFLTPIDGYPNSDYINANYVTGPSNIKGYYIATQGPMQNTVDDFWRMVWEQQTKVILMLTHLVENGLPKVAEVLYLFKLQEKCADYLPESEVLDCSRVFGDFQITLKKREVKEKYIISSLQLKNMVSNSWRDVTHFWYLGWPEKGVPSEANSLIAFLIEARSYMKAVTTDNKNGLNGIHNATQNEHNPVVVHCSPGTGRTGVAMASDIAIREFETTRLVDIPKIVYRIRRDRANAIQTKEQYIFIYKVVSLYATKLTGGAMENL